MIKATYIKLPMRSRSASEPKLDPFFPVEMQSYLRSDGIDDGLRAIVNKVTGKTMGAVKKNYNMVTHKEASDVVHNFLDKIGIDYVSESRKTGTAGAKFYEIISFPSYKFSPDGSSTAPDGSVGLVKKEDMICAIQIKNSYDKTARISWDSQVFRLVCENGMAVGMKERQFMSYRHNQEINFDKVRDNLISGLEESINIVQIAYDRLNGEAGLPFLRDLIEGEWPDKFRLAVLEKVAPFAKIEMETIDGETDKSKILKIKSIETPESAWSIYNVATDVASHTLTSPVDQDKIGRRIAKRFAISA